MLHKNPLSEFTMSTPAIAQSSLFLRTKSTLYRIGTGLTTISWFGVIG